MTNATEKSYFDLHTTGIGYLNRIREVQPKKGQPFLACDIAALNGESNDVVYVRFDTKVAGEDAQHLVRRCMPAAEAKKRILIGFKLGDLWTDLFTYSKGQNAGKPGISLKARLLFISFIKIDGKQVYKAESKPVSDDESHAAQAAAAERLRSEGAPSTSANESFDEGAADIPIIASAASF